jgi:hypothetical protein
MLTYVEERSSEGGSIVASFDYAFDVLGNRFCNRYAGPAP